MEPVIPLSAATQATAGVLLLSVVAIELGGTFLLRIVRGREPVTPFQLAFARAGHAHAGVLVTLALVCQILVDGAALAGWQGTIARSGVPAAAVLMSAGFFLSSAGSGRTRPNRLIVVLYAGAVSLTAGVIALGAGLLTS